MASILSSSLRHGLLGDHHLRRLDDCRYLVAGFQAKLFGRRARDQGNDFHVRRHFDDHLGHDIAELHRLDDTGKLVTSTEHDELLEKYTTLHSSRAVVSFSFPPRAEHNSKTAEP